MQAVNVTWFFQEDVPLVLACSDKRGNVAAVSSPSFFAFYPTRVARPWLAHVRTLIYYNRGESNCERNGARWHASVSRTSAACSISPFSKTIMYRLSRTAELELSRNGLTISIGHRGIVWTSSESSVECGLRDIPDSPEPCEARFTSVHNKFDYTERFSPPPIKRNYPMEWTIKGRKMCP